MSEQGFVYDRVHCLSIETSSCEWPLHINAGITTPVKNTRMREHIQTGIRPYLTQIAQKSFSLIDLESQTTVANMR